MFHGEHQVENVTVVSFKADPPGVTLSGVELSIALAGTATALTIRSPGTLGGVVIGHKSVQVAPVIEDADWSRVAIDVDMRPPNARISVLTGGELTITPMFPWPNALDEPVITLGQNADDTHATACSVLFDDVIFDAR